MKIIKLIRLIFCIDRVWNTGFFYLDLIDNRKIGQWIRLKNEFYSFYADPYIFKHENKYYVLVEEFYYFTGRGAITLIELDRNLSFKSKKVILKDDQHYSFPRIFSLNDKLYLSVENISGGQGFQYYELSNELQIVKSFRLMVDHLVVDPILIVSPNGVCLSFNSDREISNFNKNSYLLKMESLNPTTKFKPILVKSNLYGSRNAGVVSFSSVGETLYSQVSTGNTYGYGVVATDLMKNKKRADCLFLRRFTPRNLIGSKKYLGVHTVNNCESLFVFDFVEYKLNWFRFLSRILTLPMIVMKRFKVIFFIL